MTSTRRGKREDGMIRAPKDVIQVLRILASRRGQSMTVRVSELIMNAWKRQRHKDGR